MTDPNGELVALHKMDQTQAASVGISIGKARTAARFRRPSEVFFNAMQQPTGAYFATLSDPPPVASPGGIPLVEGGKIIGAKLKNEATSGDGLLPVGTPIDYEGVGTMSKSKNNGVDPQDLIEKYGADTARLYTMFTAPPEATLEWNDAAVEGSYRFLRRVWNFGVKLSAMDMGAATAGVASAKSLNDVEFGKEAKALRREIHSVLKQVDYDYQRMQYNTVVSGAMKMINALEDFKATDSAGAQVALIEGFGILLRALYPVTPHIAHALWSSLGYADHLGDLLDAAWPQVDAGAQLAAHVGDVGRGNLPLVVASHAGRPLDQLLTGLELRGQVSEAVRRNLQRFELLGVDLPVLTHLIFQAFVGGGVEAFNGVDDGLHNFAI